ncbi:hypothetical protein Tco_0113200, partial [Tanacetum coccineum]
VDLTLTLTVEFFDDPLTLLTFGFDLASPDTGLELVFYFGPGLKVKGNLVFVANLERNRSSKLVSICANMLPHLTIMRIKVDGKKFLLVILPDLSKCD